MHDCLLSFKKACILEIKIEYIQEIKHVGWNHDS